MRGVKRTLISSSLYNLIIKEQSRLQGREDRKRNGFRKKKITLIDASNSLVRNVWGKR